MKTAISSIILLCAISINGQNIQFPESDRVTGPSVNTQRQINQGTSSYDKQFETYFADGVTRLTLYLNYYVPAIKPDLTYSDIAFGPLTVAGALVLVMLASVGQTADEIAIFLGLAQSESYFNNPLAVHKPISNLLDKIDTNEISSLSQTEIVSYATAIFIQQDFPIRQEFLKAIKETYNSDIISLNFRKKSIKARDEINSWVSRHTNAKIPTLFHSPPSPETTAIIASVLYFKAAWEHPFFEGHTKSKPFFKNGRNQPSDRKVDMMANGGDFPYYKDRNSNVEIMGFPYKGKRITMYVLLPHDSNQENVRALENILTPDYIHLLVRSTRPTEAVVTFPKLKIISSIDLKSILQTVNISSMFNPRQSNFALMSSGAHNVGQLNPTIAQNGFVPNRSSGGQEVPRRNPAPQSQGTPSAGTVYNYPSTGGQTNSFETQDHGPNPSNGNQNVYLQYPTVGTQNNYRPTPSPGTQNLFAETQSNYPTPVQQSDFRESNIFLQEQVNRKSDNLARLPNNVGQNYPTTPKTVHSPVQTTDSSLNDRLVFVRAGEDCSTNQYYSSNCANQTNQGDHSVTGPKFSTDYTNPLDELDKIRKSANLINPGIYADQIIHKVYIEITESGTEAAAATGISLNRSGGRVAFRLDVPFIFFIYHEESKVILFWGSVKNPTPSNGS